MQQMIIQGVHKSVHNMKNKYATKEINPISQSDLFKSLLIDTEELNK